MALAHFHPAVAAWFRKAFQQPTPAQLQAWPAIQSGRHALIAAPTGSGKTLAAFLAAIDDLVRRGVDNPLPDETFVVYVSPLKALSNDIRINLEAPLNGIRDELMILGLPDVEIRTCVRTGDTPQAERDRMRRQPPHIVVTTPESLYILLGSDSGRAMLASTRTVIVDEIHALAPNKRGAHLALSLERLEALCGRRLTRIGLSATQKPIEEVARYLVGAGPNLGSGAQSPTPSPPKPPLEGEAARASIIRPSGLSPRLAAIDCEIVDVGYSRKRDLAIELPQTPLTAVMSGDTWGELYTRLAELIEQHRTTLVFVNTRRMAERLARHLSEKLGKNAVTSHHGSLAREQRLAAEQRLKRGELRALVATASLELGIDIGDVDLVCQIASPRSISAFLQRVGRSGHSVGGTPKGRLFALSRDDLIECTALLDAVRRGELDTLHVERDALDVLAQQIVAEVACRDWSEDELFATLTRSYPFSNLSREKFTEIVRMLAEGYATRRGPRAAYLHRDAVNGVLRARRGARLTALTSGGAIPDTADYDVVLEPQAQKIGTVHEDFAVESMAGDIFQLGNTSYRVLRVERGTVRVEDAQGLPPTLPFWLGEAPGRSDELSSAVGRLRQEISNRLIATGGDAASALLRVPSGEGQATKPQDPRNLLNSSTSFSSEPAADGDGSSASDRAIIRHTVNAPHLSLSALDWLTGEVGLNESAARQIVEYLGGAKAAFGMLPTQQVLAMERFFDESGGMQLIIHSPFGSRLNRAWGLALRKRFCRSFNFELQAAATEDAIILSLSTSHSFPLDEVTRYLHSNTAREVLVQALLDAPMFGLRWRWNATTALALPRFVGGNKVPPQLQRMKSEDLLATVFPDQVACLENIVGERQIPDHPLVAQTMYDCLHQAMDIEGFEALLRRLESGQIHFVCRDLTAPSPLAAEILTSRPYTFLDDAPLEERRTQAVMSRRWGDLDSTDDFGKLDADAIATVRDEAWPEARNADELHEALMGLGFVSADELQRNVGWPALFEQLVSTRRATRVLVAQAQCAPLTLPQGSLGGKGRGEEDAQPQQSISHANLRASPSPPVQPGEGEPTVAASAIDTRGLAGVHVAAERLPEFAAIFAGADLVSEPSVAAPAEFAAIAWTKEEALVEILRGRLTGLGPVRAADIAATLHLPQVDIDTALVALETEGYAMRGRFTPGAYERPVAQANPGRLSTVNAVVDAQKSGDGADADADATTMAAATIEWCERHLLARIHRYTVKRLRREIEPVSPRDLMRFLFEWQHVAPGSQVSGPDALAAVLAQLEGCEVAAAAWESDILPARVAGYEISWLDDLCLAGRIAWSRLRAPYVREADDSAGARASGPVRATPVVLLQRRNMPSWTALASSSQATPTLSSRAQAVADELKHRGASFFDELAASTHLLQTELEDALSELVAAGMVTSDSFAGLRALLLPTSRRPSATRRRGRRTALFGIADAGRWSLLRRPALSVAPGTGQRNARAERHGSDPELSEFVARTLLKRYGVICWRLLAREPQWLPPWRELLRVYHRLEARGEIRGGRFIAGLTGEQFALPEAIGLLRGVRHKAHDGALVSISGADPLNLVGFIVAGSKVPNQAGARVLYRDGAPIAALVGGQFTTLEPMDEAAEWAARSKLLRAQSEYVPAEVADSTPDNAA